jgi:hypothetical protein
VRSESQSLQDITDTYDAARQRLGDAMAETTQAMSMAILSACMSFDECGMRGAQRPIGARSAAATSAGYPETKYAPARFQETECSEGGA